MVENITYVLGGTVLSGAEKRIINTAIAVSGHYNVSLIMTKRLYSRIIDDDNYRLALSGSVEVLPLVRPGDGAGLIVKFVLALYAPIVYFNALKKREGCVHVVLFNLYSLILLLPTRLTRKHCWIFEVTSPDVSSSVSIKVLGLFVGFADRFICVSENVYRVMMSSYWFFTRGLKKKTSVRKSPYVSTIVRGSDFLSQKKNVVVFAHRLIERKNPWIAVKAFAFLAKKHSDWSFEVYGNGPLSGEIELYCSAAGLHNLNYLGYHDDIPCVLARSKIFVSLIYPDNFPSQSVFEAMACGNALVISDTGDSCERFLCGDNGVSVELDVDSLIKGVEKLIVSEDLAFKNKESIRFFEKHYSEQDYVNESLEIYRSLDFY